MGKNCTQHDYYSFRGKVIFDSPYLGFTPSVDTSKYVQKEECVALTSESHNLSRAGPKQLYALAYLGCTRAVGTFYFYHKHKVLSVSASIPQVAD